MNIDLDTLASFGFEFTNIDDGDDDDYALELKLEDICGPPGPCAVVLDHFIEDYLSSELDSQSSFGTTTSLSSSAAIVSPTSSSDLLAELEEVEEAKPNTFTDLFTMIDEYSDAVGAGVNVEVKEEISYVPQQQQQQTQYFDIIQVVSTEQALPDATGSADLVPVASFIVDSNGLLQVYDPTARVGPKKRGRKPRPRDKVIPGDSYCEKCDKNFKSRRGLLQHANTYHSGVKPNVCDICGKRFDRLEDLQTHRGRHSLENKPLGCRECPKRFMYQSDLNRHVRMEHGKAPFSCSICGKGFGRRDHVEKHESGHKYNTIRMPN